MYSRRGKYNLNFQKSAELKFAYLHSETDIGRSLVFFFVHTFAKWTSGEKEFRNLWPFYRYIGLIWRQKSVILHKITYVQWKLFFRMLNIQKSCSMLFFTYTNYKSRLWYRLACFHCGQKCKRWIKISDSNSIGNNSDSCYHRTMK